MVGRTEPRANLLLCFSRLVARLLALKRRMITRSISRIFFALVWIALIVVISAPLHGAQRTWEGGGNDWDWRNSANWDGRIRLDPIEQGDTLVFPEGPAKLINTNDFGANTNFNALIYSGEDYRSYGNRIGLSNGVSVTHASGLTALHLPILLRRDQTFSVSSANAFLHLFGEINIGFHDLTFDGDGGIVLVSEIANTRFGTRGRVFKTGSGRLTIFQQTDHDAPTIVNGGTLAVENRMTNSIVTVQSGGTLRGSSRIGGLNAIGGLVFPGGTTPDALECRGDATLAAGSTLRLRLNGTTAGINYDQLDVVGTVTLGGTLDLVFGFTPAVGDRFTIIENDGTDDVVGTFAGLPDGAVFTANGRPFRISYGSRFGLFRDNDVTIEAIPALSVWDAGGGQNRRWSEPFNWVGDVVPMPGDNIQFSAFTATGSELRTTNDFPAGRAVGNITFIGGHHRLEGNLIQLHGGIDLNADPNQSLTALRRIDIEAPLTLAANQAFQVNHTNSHFFLHAPVDTATFNLTAESHVLGGLGSSDYSQITFFGGLSGQGTLIKTGPGNLSFLSASTCANTIVNGGTLRSSAFEPSAISGNVTVNSGAALQPLDDVLGDVTVNTGGFLRGGFHSYLGRNVDINGGTFVPSDTASVQGNLRMRNGAEYHVSIEDSSTIFVPPNGVPVGGTAELAGCTLVLTYQFSEPPVPGDKLSVLGSVEGLTGTFTGVPEGARLALGGHVFTVRYSGFSVVLTADEAYVWDGGGAGNFWTTPGNWQGDYAPVGGAGLIFPSGVAKLRVTNDLPAQTSFRMIEFSGSGYTLEGNRLSVTSLSNTLNSGQTIVHAPLSPGLISVGGTSLLRLDAPVSGGILDKFGTGTLRFGGAESNTVGLRVLAGQFELAKTGAPAISSRLEIGSSSSSAVAVLLGDDQIADSAVVIVASSSRLEIGQYSETIGSLSGNGTVTLGELFLGGSLRVLGGTFPGSITGRGVLTKAGSGTLVLPGTNTFIGNTVLDQGNLAVDGAISGAVRLNGGVLMGVGRVGSIIAASGGILSPGKSGADFQNALDSGDVNLNSAAIYQPRLTSLDPNYENSYLQVAGAVSLGNATLSLSIPTPGFTPPTNKIYLIIVNDGSDPVLGTFAGLPEGAMFGARGFAFRISYVGGTGNDITVTRVPGEPASFSSATALGNGQVRFEGVGIPGAVYAIEAASNLNPIIQWAPLFNRTGNASGIFEILETNAFQRPMRFYRAVLP